MAFYTHVALLLCATAVVSRTLAIQGDVVTVEGGALRGQRWQASNGEELSLFLGIPYAKPPLGALRFAPPVPADSWRPTEWNATYFRSACQQKTWFLKAYSFGKDFNDVSEDCLYLNVFTPRSALSAGGGGLPVMVWIHGGAYNYGSGIEYAGQELAARGVVLVTINYRLGVLGFLTAQSDLAPGNAGLRDQIMALQWIQHNIASFGGDPSKVTILGQSAGGGSVSLLQFSPLARGLFRAVVPQSGISLSPWAVYRPPHSPRDNTLALARHFNCPTNSDSAMIGCLRNESAADLVSAPVYGPPMIATWAPSIDGHVIPDVPERMLEQGRITRVPVMTGTVPQEAADELEDEDGVEKGFSATRYRNMVHAWASRFGSEADKVEHALLREYPVTSDAAVNRENLIQLKSDYGYVAPHVRFSQAYARLSGHIWMYSFRYAPANNSQPSWMGVYHADELYYEFGAPLWNSSFPLNYWPVEWEIYEQWTASEKALSRDLITIWTNFAKNLDPNPVPGLTKSWGRYSESHHGNHDARAYLVIKRPMTLASDQEATRMHLWNSELPLLLAAPHILG